MKNTGINQQKVNLDNYFLNEEVTPFLVNREEYTLSDLVGKHVIIDYITTPGCDESDNFNFDLSKVGELEGILDLGTEDKLVEELLDTGKSPDDFLIIIQEKTNTEIDILEKALQNKGESETSKRNEYVQENYHSLGWINDTSYRTFSEDFNNEERHLKKLLTYITNINTVQLFLQLIKEEKEKRQAESFIKDIKNPK